MEREQREKWEAREKEEKVEEEENVEEDQRVRVTRCGTNKNRMAAATKPHRCPLQDHTRSFTTVFSYNALGSL